MAVVSDIVIGSAARMMAHLSCCGARSPGRSCGVSRIALPDGGVEEDQRSCHHASHATVELVLHESLLDAIDEDW